MEETSERSSNLIIRYLKEVEMQARNEMKAKVEAIHRRLKLHQLKLQLNSQQ
jgi:hypothetical protein